MCGAMVAYEAKETRMVLSDDSNRSVVRVLARLQDAFKTYRVGML